MEIWKIYKVYCPHCENVVEWCNTKQEAQKEAQNHKRYWHTNFFTRKVEYTIQD